MGLTRVTKDGVSGTPANTLGLCSRPMRGAALRDTRRGAEAMCAGVR